MSFSPLQIVQLIGSLDDYKLAFMKRTVLQEFRERTSKKAIIRILPT